MRVGVIVFPGSNCDRDAVTAVQSMLDGAWGDTIKGDVIKIWHRDSHLPTLDLVILPGGFSYGDYLRSGAMSARSPIMSEISAHAARGGYVLGICNGFQILTEAGLLPGALMRNRDLRFICKNVSLRVEQTTSAFTRFLNQGSVISLPVAHHDGNYRADAHTLQSLNDNGQIVFRYADTQGNVTEASNINGSAENIAGIINSSGNVLGMMPHPERACDTIHSGISGRALFQNITKAIAA